MHGLHGLLLVRQWLRVVEGRYAKPNATRKKGSCSEAIVLAG